MIHYILLALFILSLLSQASAQWLIAPPIPKALSNNAVTSLDIGGINYTYSFMGIDTTKIWSGITRQAFSFNSTTGDWSEIASVPGTEGRIGSAAVGFRGKVYLFGGYSVAANGSETTYPNVDIYDPGANSWSSGAPVPVPVDDQVVGVWRNSLIYLISGWSTNQNVKNVQIYDPVLNSWQQATEIPGAGVFGHSGGIVGDTIVYVDGARDSFNFPLNGGNFMGIINPQQPDSITWSSLPAHPGTRKYRAAAATLGKRIFFVGGTDNSYNFNGIGYNGQPSEPSDEVFAFNSVTGGWEDFGLSFRATMDHRGLGTRGDFALTLVGGMMSGQTVTNNVYFFAPVDPVSQVGPQDEFARIDDFQLIGNYPNPFNPITRIRYSLQKRLAVQLEVFSVSGERVATLVDEVQSPGEKEATFYAADFSSGIYLYRLTTEFGSQTKKMVILK